MFVTRHVVKWSPGLVLLCAVTAAEAQSDLPTWTLSPAPVVTIGAEGEAATEFSRITAAFRLSSGIIAVANGATSEIRLFNERGHYLRSFGRRGAGPGEFRTLGWLGRSGDTAFVFDPRLRRITSVALGPEPELIRTVLLTATGDRGSFFVNGRLSDGRWLVGTYATPGWDGPPGVHRLPASVGLMDADGGGAVTWLGAFEGMAVFVHNPTGNIQQATVGPIAFTPAVYATASGSNAWYGPTDADSLIVFSAPNGKRFTFRVPFPQRRPRPRP